MSLNAERKTEVVKQFAIKSGDTGSPEVQIAIDRNQSEAQSRALYDYCRTKDFHSINIDLIYGLPKQTIENFSETIRSSAIGRPDSSAPKIRPNARSAHPANAADTQISRSKGELACWLAAARKACS